MTAVVEEARPVNEIRPLSPSRRILRWWPMVAAVLFAVYAAVLPEPLRLGSWGGAPVDSLLFFAAAGAFAAAALWPTRRLRLLALYAGLCAALSRVLVIGFSDPAIDRARQVGGIAVWCLMVLFLVVITLISELASPRSYH